MVVSFLFFYPMLNKLFCKHEKSKILYISRKVVNNKKDYIYYCPNCKKYAKGRVLFDKNGKFASETVKSSLKWSKKLGDLTGYIYLGLRDGR